MSTSLKVLGSRSKVVLLIVSAFISYSCSHQVAQVSVPVTVPAQIDSSTVAALIPGTPLQMDSTTFGTSLTPLSGKVVKFYRGHAFQTQWLLDNQPSALYHAFESIIADAPKYGLRSNDYDLAVIQQKVNLIYSATDPQPKALVDLDRYITEMLFRFTTHLSVGKVTEIPDGRSIWKTGDRTDRNVDVNLISLVQTPEELNFAVAQLQPAQEQYIKLQKALAYYRALEKNTPSAIEIVKGIKVKPEDRNVIIPSIRKKLTITDMRVYPMTYDSINGAFDSLYYDAELVSAVKWFQLKHGLETDGIIGEKTLRFINQSFKEKADIIALNMERLRWTRDKYGENYIYVNVPAYSLQVFENRKPALEMRVIVGAVDKPTPIFSDELDYIVFSPTWTVPTSIIKEEIIPRLKSNAAYYANKNYAFYKDDVAIDPTTEVWDDNANPYQYRVVQQPGPDNSLGLVKFVMPNNMSVYLHDTPNHRLFSKDFRALSHGCVRLNEPARFAEYLLRDQKGWDKERIEKAMHASQPSTILLKNKYEVHIEYFTAWVDENDTVNFREDIYGHDKRQLQQLYPKEKQVDLAGL